jgi:hypothetical protein
MGMYGTLRRASAADVERLRTSPTLVESFVFGEPPPRTPTLGLFGFLRLLFSGPAAGKAPPAAQTPADGGPTPSPDDASAELWHDASDGETLSLDKAWHGLHFLLTGDADGGEEPACFLLAGGEDFGEDESGDPVGQLLSPEQVRAFAAFLGTLDRDTLARRFDPARMVALDIYPRPIWERNDEEYPPVRFLLDAFDDLRTFTSTAAASGDAVIVCIQ